MENAIALIRKSPARLQLARLFFVYKNMYIFSFFSYFFFISSLLFLSIKVTRYILLPLRLEMAVLWDICSCIGLDCHKKTKNWIYFSPSLQKNRAATKGNRFIHFVTALFVILFDVYRLQPYRSCSSNSKLKTFAEIRQHLPILVYLVLFPAVQLFVF